MRPPPRTPAGNDRLLSAEIPHGLNGYTITGPEAVAHVGKMATEDPSMVTVIYAGARGDVRGIQQVPRGLYENPRAMTEWIRGRRREFGASNAFSYHVDDLGLQRASQQLFRNGVLRDSVSEQLGVPRSLQAERVPQRPSMEVPERYRVREEERKYGPDLPPEFLREHQRQHGVAAPMTADEWRGAVPRLYEQHPDRLSFEAAVRKLRPDVQPRMMANLWDLAQYQKGQTGKEAFNFLQKSGDRVVGAPEQVKDKASLGKFFSKREKQAKDGAVGRFWYERSSEAILRLTQGDKVEAEKLAQLIAIYSPSNPVTGELGVVFSR